MRAAITDKIKAAAQASTFTAGELRRQFAYDRLLARLFLDDPQRWVLKGGGGLLARLPQARRSLDLDLYHAGLHGDLDEAISALRTAGATDLGDYFEFRFDTTTRCLAGTALGATVSVTAHLGAKPFERFPVDVAHVLPLSVFSGSSWVSPSERVPNWPEIDSFGVVTGVEHAVRPLVRASDNRFASRLRSHVVALCSQRWAVIVRGGDGVGDSREDGPLIPIRPGA
jgi:hypothetical protein